MHLRLDLDLLDALDGFEARHVDLVVEVADVRDDREVLQRLEVLGRDDIAVAGAGHHDVDLAGDIDQACHLETVHRRLQRADRVDLADDHPGALSAERLGCALAHVAVPAHEGDLATHEHVGGAVQPIRERVTDTVLVVELALGH